VATHPFPVLDDATATRGRVYFLGILPKGVSKSQKELHFLEENEQDLRFNRKSTS